MDRKDPKKINSTSHQNRNVDLSRLVRSKKKMYEKAMIKISKLFSKGDYTTLETCLNLITYTQLKKLF